MTGCDFDWMVSNHAVSGWKAPVKASVSGVSLLQLSPFFASIFPPFPQKRLILRLNRGYRGNGGIGSIGRTKRGQGELGKLREQGEQGENQCTCKNVIAVSNSLKEKLFECSGPRNA